MAGCQAHNLISKRNLIRTLSADKLLDLEGKERPREADSAVGEVGGGAGHLQQQPDVATILNILK